MKRILLAVLLLGSITASANVTIIGTLTVDGQSTEIRLDFDETTFTLKTNNTFEVFTVQEYEETPKTRTIWGVSIENKWMGVEIGDYGVFLLGDRKVEIEVKSMKIR